MAFSDEQYFQSIDSNEAVKQSFEQIKQACKTLQEATGCPNEDVDDFLQFIVGKWK